MFKLSKNQIESLGEYVERKINMKIEGTDIYNDSDHTLRFAREWARTNKLDEEKVAQYCKNNGGHCDCEVILNIYLSEVE